MDFSEAVKLLVEEKVNSNFVKSNNINDIFNYIIDIVNICSLYKWIVTNTEVIENFKNKPMKEFLELVESTLSSFAENNISEEESLWDTVSLEQLKESFQTHTDGLQILYRLSDLKTLNDLLTQPQGSKRKQSSLSGTPKKRPNKKDTATSITSVPTTSRTVGAPSSSLLRSREEILADLMQSIPSTAPTSSIGSTIFLRTHDGSSTYRSTEFPLGEKYLDLKIYDNPMDVKTKKPKELWREASFRAKIVIGRRDSDETVTKRILSLLEELQTLLLTDIINYPELELYQGNS